MIHLPIPSASAFSIAIVLLDFPMRSDAPWHHHACPGPRAFHRANLRFEISAVGRGIGNASFQGLHRRALVKFLEIAAISRNRSLMK